MKNLLIAIAVITFALVTGNAGAQIKIDLKKKIEREANKRANQKADKAVKKTFDAAEEGATSAVTSEKKTETTEGETSEGSEAGQATEEESPRNTSKGKTKKNQQPTAEEPQDEPKRVLNWAKYDFVPGTEIIFEDNQEGEQNGEFPSKWDLVQGNFENANFDGANVIYHMKCNMNGGGGIVPMLKNSTEDYLPEEFTIEFDAYFSENHQGHYTIFLGDDKNHAKLDKIRVDKKYVRIYKNSADGEAIDRGYYPGFESSMFDKTAKWRHVAISFNKRALKVYLDDARVLNIPNLGYNPTGFTIGKQNVSGNDPGYSKNFRIAKGAVPLYDKILTDGKFVTTGIKFDVNKATIKTESMGTINYVVKMMNDNPTLNFTVEGHTDSDGDDARNQSLSEARAKAISDKLQELGIASSRLKTKGWGESKPMTGNDSPEGKAQNRRVEFVKF